jgi:hypothetical protein
MSLPLSERSASVRAKENKKDRERNSKYKNGGKNKKHRRKRIHSWEERNITERLRIQIYEKLR